MRTQEQIAADYKAFRGRCKELCIQAMKEDPSLTLVRGHYLCPIWGTEEYHWWTVRPDGTIYDPTARQFPSNGTGLYVPFGGIIQCAQCGKELPEEEAIIHGNYAFCANGCCDAFYFKNECCWRPACIQQVTRHSCGICFRRKSTLPLNAPERQFWPLSRPNHTSTPPR